MTKQPTSEQPCGGSVAYDEHGNIIHQYACEVHLFDPGVCDWQRRTNEQPRERWS